MICKTAFLFILTLASFAVQAENYAVLNLGSHHHYDSEIDLKEFNPGIGGEIELTEYTHVSVGLFRNSYGDTTYYLGGGVESSRWLDLVSVGAEAVLLHGYAEEEIPAAAAPYLSIGTERLNVKIMHVPVRKSKNGTYAVGAGVTTLQLRAGLW